MKEAIKLVANNKKAYHDYFIDEKFECGIELFGTEVKSIRMGKCSVKEAFACNISKRNCLFISSSSIKRSVFIRLSLILSYL